MTSLHVVGQNGGWPMSVFLTPDAKPIFGGTYYWYGVRYGGAATYAASPTKMNSDTSFVAVTTYSSTDLARWKHEADALSYDSVASKLEMSRTTWIGRVGAAYNATTKKYVIVGQYQGTPDTQQFFATSDTPNGAFTVDHAQPTITNVANGNCCDQAVFSDDDGSAYIVCSSLSGRSNIYIIPLRPADFLEAMPATRIFGGAGEDWISGGPGKSAGPRDRRLCSRSFLGNHRCRRRGGAGARIPVAPRLKPPSIRLPHRTSILRSPCTDARRRATVARCAASAGSCQSHGSGVRRRHATGNT